MDDLGSPVLVLLLDRNEPVDGLEQANSPVAAVPDVAAVVVDVTIVGVVVVEEEEDEDDGDEEAAALAPVAPVLGDAVQRLLLYVDFLGFRTELIHALPRLVRDVIQGLFRVI